MNSQSIESLSYGCGRLNVWLLGPLSPSPQLQPVTPLFSPGLLISPTCAADLVQRQWGWYKNLAGASCFCYSNSESVMAEAGRMRLKRMKLNVAGAKDYLAAEIWRTSTYIYIYIYIHTLYYLHIYIYTYMYRYWRPMVSFGLKPISFSIFLVNYWRLLQFTALKLDGAVLKRPI